MCVAEQGWAAQGSKVPVSPALQDALHPPLPSLAEPPRAMADFCGAGLGPHPAWQCTPGPALGAWLRADRPCSVCTPFNGEISVAGSKAAKPLS